MQQFSVVLNQLIGMGVMLSVGAVCVRTKLLNEESLQGICRLILNVGIPMLVFSNAISGTTRADLFASAAIIGITILLYALLIASMWLLAKLLRLPGERGRMFQGAFVFGNAGFIRLAAGSGIVPETWRIVFRADVADRSALFSGPTAYGSPSRVRIGRAFCRTSIRRHHWGRSSLAC